MKYTLQTSGTIKVNGKNYELHITEELPVYMAGDMYARIYEDGTKIVEQVVEHKIPETDMVTQLQTEIIDIEKVNR